MVLADNTFSLKNTRFEAPRDLRNRKIRPPKFPEPARITRFHAAVMASVSTSNPASRERFKSGQSRDQDRLVGFYREGSSVAKPSAWCRSWCARSAACT